MPPKSAEDMLMPDGQPQDVKPHRVDEEEEDDEETNKPGRERRKIEIKFIDDKSRRHITFSKRKAGIMKKAYELSVLTGTQVLLLVVSETGLVYTFTTPKLQPLVTKAEGKNLIQACLNAPEEPVQPPQSQPQVPHQAQPPMVDDLGGDDHLAAAAAAAQVQNRLAVSQAVAQQQQQQRVAQAQAMGMRPAPMYSYPVQGMQDRDEKF
ncbi:MADS box transcription factor Mcm1 [Lipomyces oligophaga]|uniref:MADS box transcription factor Mcm1 n=1 Tax=Lipomyces oligophaga TaxID=45792 RepID=UPI0034CF04CC